MPKTIAQLLSQLKPDPWRKTAAFSPELDAANRQLFDSSDPAHAANVLNDWIQKRQPCLFGKAAATLDLISYCVLTESDLFGAEEDLMAKIQNARTDWTRDAYYGRKSGFVISTISMAIANATPDATMKELAARLCSFYLETEIKEDTVHLEDVFLEMPGQRQTTWKWRAGVNYFCAQGDGRWWRDHRIPGGMAFSVNSVGHMVKSGRLATIMQQLEESLNAPPEGWEASKIDSLEKALGLAMRTIANAADGVSGKATELLSLPDDPTQLPIPVCPVTLPPDLAKKNFCEYRGYYHTDYTLPGEYFRADVERLRDAKSYLLDFTYLFHRSVENPAFFAMAEGQQIRADILDRRAQGPRVPEEEIFLKKLKATEEIIHVSDVERLAKAIRPKPLSGPART